MSADNYIYIDKKNFKIWMCTASWVGGKLKDQKIRLIGKGKTLDDAIKIGAKEPTKYGISLELWAK